MSSELNKQIRVTEETHERLMRIKLQIFGVEAVHNKRFSEVIDVLAERELNREGADE